MKDPNSNPSQTAIVRKHLKSGFTLTAREASEYFGIDRLASRVAEINKESKLVKCDIVKVGNGKRIGRYHAIDINLL